MKYVMIALLMAAAAPAIAQQKKGPKARKPAATTKANTPAKPRQQSVVVLQQYPAYAYYPDYRTFYDSSRHTYTYLNGQEWMTTADRPAFMKEAEVGKYRVQILHDEQMLSPNEQTYQRFMELYPAMAPTPTRTVPLITITPDGK